MYNQDTYIYQEFHKNFAKYQDIPIAIYGIGERTGRLLEHIGNDYRIAGLLDGKISSGDIWDKPILSLEQTVQAGVRVIIIVARSAVTGTIYHRIKNFAEENKIKVFDIHGEDLAVKYRERDCDIPFYHKNFDMLWEECEKHDVITFDIFDTLLVRKTLLPRDIFYYVERRMVQKLKDSDRSIQEGETGIIKSFSAVRMEAEDRCYKRGINPTIDQIYNEIQEISGADTAAIKNYLEAEFEEELRFIEPRKRMRTLFNRLKDKKTIYLISDMYLPGGFIEKLLAKCGYTGYKEVFVSCEYGCSKRDGLFEKFLEKYESGRPGKRILHIGDHEIADGECAREAGIDSFCIMSGREMLENSAYRILTEKADGLFDHLMLGLFCYRAFDDPFVFYEKKGRLEITDHRTLAYLFCAPVFAAFSVWFMQMVGKMGCDFIMYTARDGYLIKKLCEVIKDKQDWSVFPEGAYIYTSRRTLNAATMFSRVDIDRIVQHEYYGTIEELLHERFGVDTGIEEEILTSESKSRQDELRQQNGMLDVQRRWGDVSGVVDCYEEKILDRCTKERNCYIRYLNQKVSKDSKQIACMDFIAAGSVQLGLGKLMPDRNLCGFYFVKKKTEEREPETLRTFSFYASKGEFRMDSNLYRYYLFLEMILTSPEPALCCIDENMKPVFMQENRTSEQIETAMEMQEEIIKYAEELADLYPNLRQEKISEKCADSILGMIGKEYTVVKNEGIMNMVLKDEYMAKEFNIFDRV